MTRTTKKEIKKYLVLENKPINLSVIIGDRHLYFASYTAWLDYVKKFEAEMKLDIALKQPTIYEEIKAYQGVGPASRNISQQLAQALAKPIIYPQPWK